MSGQTLQAAFGSNYIWRLRVGVACEENSNRIRLPFCFKAVNFLLAWTICTDKDSAVTIVDFERFLPAPWSRWGRRRSFYLERSCGSSSASVLASFSSCLLKVLDIGNTDIGEVCGTVFWCVERIMTCYKTNKRLRIEHLGMEKDKDNVQLFMTTARWSLSMTYSVHSYSTAVHVL